MPQRAFEIRRCVRGGVRKIEDRRRFSDRIDKEGKFSSPSWHFVELQRTEEDTRAGRIEFIDWEQAKKSIRHCAK